MSDLFEQVGVVYLVDAEKVFPDLTKRQTEQFHAMIEDLEESLIDMEHAKETESGIGAFGSIAVTMKGDIATTQPILAKTLQQVIARWKRRKPQYAQK